LKYWQAIRRSHSPPRCSPLAFRLGKLRFGEIGQLQVVEEQIDEFVAAQNEAKASSLSPVPGALCRPPAAFARTRQDVASMNFLLPGSTMSRVPALAAKTWFMHPIEWDRDLAPSQHIPDVPVFRRIS